jgi:hypothetical protein
MRITLTFWRTGAWAKAAKNVTRDKIALPVGHCTLYNVK